MSRLSIIIVLAIISILTIHGCNKGRWKDKADRYESLYRIEKQQTETWQDESGNWRAKAETAAVSKEMLKELSIDQNSKYGQLHKDFEGLNKKLKNLQNYTSTNTETVIRYETLVHDTVFVRANGAQVVAKKFYWTDSSSFNSFSGVIVNDTIKGSVSITDSLEVVVYWTRKFPVIGKKRYETQVKSKNPSTKIVHVQSIIQKK